MQRTLSTAGVTPIWALDASRLSQLQKAAALRREKEKRRAGWAGTNRFTSKWAKNHYLTLLAVTSVERVELVWQNCFLNLGTRSLHK